MPKASFNHKAFHEKKGKHRVILISCSILLHAFDLDFGALL